MLKNNSVFTKQNRQVQQHLPISNNHFKTDLK